MSLFTLGASANALAVPAWLLFATRGLPDEPSPLQPWELVQEWASTRPGERRPRLLEDSNHYTVVMGERGAHEVGPAIRKPVRVGAVLAADLGGAVVDAGDDVERGFLQPVRREQTLQAERHDRVGVTAGVAGQ